MTKEYNGFRNRETWNVVLWLRNEGTVYERMIDRLNRFAAPWTVGDAKHIAEFAIRAPETRDGVRLDDPAIDWNQVLDMMKEEME